MEVYQAFILVGLIMAATTLAKIFNDEGNWEGYAFAAIICFISGIVVSFIP